MLPEEGVLLRWPLGRRRRLPDEELDLLELEPGLLEDLGPPLRDRPPLPLGVCRWKKSPAGSPPSPLRAGGPLGRRLLKTGMPSFGSRNRASSGHSTGIFFFRVSSIAIRCSA